MAKPFQALLLHGYTISIITAHMCQARTARRLRRAPLLVLQNSGSRVFR